MEDKNIVKALECCLETSGVNCAKCPYCENCVTDENTSLMMADALDLINRQKEEIERLKEENKLLINNDVSNKYPNCVLVEKGRIYTRTLEDYDELIGDISAEAYKEFAERLKELKYQSSDWSHGEHPFVVEESDIDNTLYELIGE